MLFKLFLCKVVEPGRCQDKAKEVTAIQKFGTSAKFSPRQQQVQNFPQLVIKFILKNIRTASNPASTN